MSSLQTLQSLYVLHTEVEVIFDADEIPNNAQQVNSSLQWLELGDLPKLRDIWRGPKNFLLLQHLNYLRIWNCDNLRVVFPTSILRSLPQLRILHIQGCKELEEIIGDDEEEENQSVLNPYQSVVFQNLTTIEIENCDKLKCVFPISTCHVLPHLEDITIYSCKELEAILKENQNVLNSDSLLSSQVSPESSSKIVIN